MRQWHPATASMASASRVVSPVHLTQERLAEIGQLRSREAARRLGTWWAADRARCRPLRADERRAARAQLARRRRDAGGGSPGGLADQGLARRDARRPDLPSVRRPDRRRPLRARERVGRDRPADARRLARRRDHDEAALAHRAGVRLLERARVRPLVAGASTGNSSARAARRRRSRARSSP